MKVGVVGSGLVGATAAYTLVVRGVCTEIALVDKNADRARAEADDILHAAPFTNPVRVSAGDYDQLSGSRVVIIAAGVSQRPEETRLQLLERNASVFREVVPAILAHAPDAMLVVATNPVDVMTHLAARYAAERGVPSSRVLGSGTTLDTARFRALLSQHLGVDAFHVHGYVVGEHGDSEVLTWSLVTVAGFPLDEFCEQRGICLDELQRREMDDQVRMAAYAIIRGKDATYYGIGAALSRIVDVILRDQRSILTVTTPAADVAGVPDVSVSMPRLLGGSGIIETFPLPLDSGEQAKLHDSALVVHRAIEGLDAA